MNGFFGIDGPFNKYGSMLADAILLSLLWLLFSIPLITVGASTTGLFYVTTRRLSDKEGYLFRDFWKSFWSNFVQSTMAWLFILLVGWVLVFNIQNSALFGSNKHMILAIQLVFLLELIFVSIFTFPLIARFEMNFKTLLMTAFFMANKHFLTSLLCAMLAAFILFISLSTGIFFVAAAGIYAFSSSYFIMRIFKKYRPEIDDDNSDGYIQGS